MRADCRGPCSLGAGGVKLSEWAQRRCTGDDGAVWSPDGLRLAAIDLEVCCDVYVFRPDGSSTHKLPFDTSSAVAWSPDGRELAYFAEEDLQSTSPV